MHHLTASLPRHKRDLHKTGFRYVISFKLLVYRPMPPTGYSQAVVIYWHQFDVFVFSLPFTVIGMQCTKRHRYREPVWGVPWIDTCWTHRHMPPWKQKISDGRALRKWFCKLHLNSTKTWNCGLCSCTSSRNWTLNNTLFMCGRPLHHIQN